MTNSGQSSCTVCLKTVQPNRVHIQSKLQILLMAPCLGLFAGMLDVKKVPSLGDRLKFRMSVAMGVWSEGDHRDWEAIRNWAESLRSLLK